MLLWILILGIPLIVFITATLAKNQRETKKNRKAESVFGKLGCIFSVIWIIALALKIVNPEFISGVPSSTSDDLASSPSEYAEYKWSENAKNTSSARIDKWINLDVLDLNIDLEKAYIDPLFWNSIDYDKKDELIKTILIYTEVQKSQNVTSFDFYDKRSGRKIAEWTKLMGVEIL